ncbi:MAG: hypothetical protein KJ698_06785 [Actinobacteria bacterium]|nr:hypothetical protein [Actinomycetota bacterium]MBU1494369.1 hypothetical protein [Actinomycetota bacterium]
MAARHTSIRSRPGLLVAALLMAATVVAGIGSPLALGQSSPDRFGPWFEWSMPDRFGLDQDHDGLIDMPNTMAYVQGAAAADCRPICPDPGFAVAFVAHLGDALSAASFPRSDHPPVTYQWTMDPDDGPVQTFSRHAPQLVVSLPEGRVEVTLQVQIALPFGTFGLTTGETIEVEDVLIVAIGDSYASGDGNPEVRRAPGESTPTWGDGVGDPAVESDHAAAHRTSVAWPSQLAIDLERANPRTSVTFLSVAASGATVDRGLLGPQNSRLPLAQVPRVAEMVGERHIDLLLVSVGGNDIGFSQLIAGLVDADRWLDPICYGNDLGNIWASVADGEWNRVSHLSWSITNPFRIGCVTDRVPGGANLAGLNRLPTELDRLAEQIEATLDTGRILIMEYPDPTGYSDGSATETCDQIVGDAAPLGLHEINRGEQRLGRSEVLDPLNADLWEAAARHDWDYVGGVVAAFTDGHGYCAEWPDYGYPPAFAQRPALLWDRLDYPDAWYRHPGLAATPPRPGPVGWYRTAGQSVVLQGPDSRVDTTGTLHPNELGHRAMANLALAFLARG